MVSRVFGEAAMQRLDIGFIGHDNTLEHKECLHNGCPVMNNVFLAVGFALRMPLGFAFVPTCKRIDHFIP